jgi:tetratricopeptide (TPR) repeat protein
VVVEDKGSQAEVLSFASGLRAELASWPAVTVLDSSTEEYRRALGGRGLDDVDVVRLRALPAAGDSSRATVGVTRGGSNVEEALSSVAFRSRDGVTSSAATRLVAMRILAGPRAVPDSSPGIETLRRPDRVALLRYVNAWSVLRDGMLDSAATLFRAATTAAPDFAAAHFRTAQTLAWRSVGDVNAWRSEAERVLPFTASLGVVDSLNAVALVAMAERRYPDACALYRLALAREPRSFSALLGLGECQRLDRAVVPDQNSPTKFRFRTNHLETLRAYVSALDALPSPKLGNLFENVPSVTLASLQRTRRGFLVSASARTFLGLPSVEGDSVVVWPQPAERFANSESGTVPDSYMQAIRYGRALFVDFARRWARNADATLSSHAGLSLALELSGSYEEALHALEAANRLSVSKAESLDVVTSRSRLHIRRGSMPNAAADARLGLGFRTAGLSEDAVLRLASFSALLGSRDDLASIAEGMAGPGTVQMPGWLRKLYGAAYAPAMLRECESVNAHVSALDSALVAHASAVELESIRSAWVAPLARMSATCNIRTMSRFLTSELPFDRALRAIVANDSVRARSILDSLVSRRRGASASAVAWDFEFAETSLLLQIGDTTRVARRLEASLNDLASMSEYTFDFPEQSAGLRNGLLLAARLSELRSGGVTSTKWRAWAAELHR